MKTSRAFRTTKRKAVAPKSGKNLTRVRMTASQLRDLAREQQRKKAQIPVVFSEDPNDWIPSDEEEFEEDGMGLRGEEGQEDEGQDDHEFAKKDPDAIPVSQLKWKEVTPLANAAFFANASDKHGFLCLEELDGVDVEVVTAQSGAKMVKFKKSGKVVAKDDPTAKPARPEMPFSANETAAYYIPIDEFDEATAAFAPKTSASATDAKAATKEASNTEGSQKLVVTIPIDPTKPLNKRQRAALKRMQQTADAGSTSDVADPTGANATYPGQTSEASATPTALTFVKSPHAPHISPAIHASWSKFRLHPALLRAITEQGFSTPTDIQIKSLRAALDTTRKGSGAVSGRDVIGAAATGSGKTLAFGLPVVQEIAKRDEREGVTVLIGPGNVTEEDGLDEEGESGDAGEENVSKQVNTGEKKERVLRPCTALIMTPTRELAMQVVAHLKAVAKYTSAKIVPIVGGMSLHKQRRVLSHSPDIIVATPGRLWELASDDDTLRASLKCVKFLILDEADRMLEANHFRDLESILGAISLKRQDDTAILPNPSFTPPVRRQTFVFSATLLEDPTMLSKKLNSKRPEKAPGKKQKAPADNLTEFLVRLEMNPEGPAYVHALTRTLMASGLTEARIEVLDEDKDAAVYYLLSRYPGGRTIVFVNSIDSVRRLVPVLRVCGVEAVGLHSEMQQRQRLKFLDRFRSTEGTVLIATDVAARGLDIPSVEHVIHFHLPRSTDLYVHRSGRTARAMREGLSVALVGPSEVGVYKKICHALKKEDGLTEFPLDRSILAAIKGRLTLAKKIEGAEHKDDKQKHDKDWMRKAAEEADIILDDLSDDDEVSHKNKKIRNESVAESKHTLNLAKLKAELAEMLAKPLLPLGMSASYLTSNSNRDFAKDLMETENTQSSKIMKGNKASRAVDDVKKSSKKQRVQ